MLKSSYRSVAKAKPAISDHKSPGVALNAYQCPRCGLWHVTSNLRQAFVIGRPCAICVEPADHRRHVGPLAHGGTDHPSNLQPLCSG